METVLRDIAADVAAPPLSPAPESEALREAAGAIAAAGDLDSALQAVFAGLQAILHVEHGSVRIPSAGLEANFTTYRELFWQGGDRYTWRYGRLRPGGDTARLLESGKAHYVADMGEAAAEGNVSAWLALNKYGLQSSLRVPMRAGGRIVGVLYANSRQANAFSEALIAPMQVLGDLAGAAVAHSRLRTQAQERQRRLEVAERVSAAVNAADDLDGMLARVLEEAARLVGAQRGTVALVDADRQFVRGRVGLDLPPGLLEATVRRLHAAPRPEEDVYALVVRTGEQLYTEGDHPALHRPTVERFGLHNEQRVFTPIRHAGAVIGVLTVFWMGDHQPGDEHFSMLRLIAEQAGGAIARARLAEAERAQLQARLEAEAALARQYREAEAARSEALAILDATEEGIVLLAPDGRCLSANRRFAELFRLDQHTLVGRQVGEFANLFDRIFDSPNIAGRLASRLADLETVLTIELHQQWPAKRDLEVRSTPVRTAGGEVVGRLFSFRDVTPDRLAERMKDEFVAMVSHELRTPLTSIKGYVDLLLDDGADALSAEQREFLAIVHDDVEREVALVNDLLDLTRLEAGHIALQLRPLDLAPLLGKVAASLRPLILAKRQRLTLDLPRSLPRVAGDQARLTQVFTNLLANAHKYTPVGGRLSVSTATDETSVRVDVRDSGVGLSAEEQVHLFTKFYRAKNRATDDAGGTGLGLVITRALVEQHDGQITVASAPEEGTTFSVTLPCTTSTPKG